MEGGRKRQNKWTKKYPVVCTGWDVTWCSTELHLLNYSLYKRHLHFLCWKQSTFWIHLLLCHPMPTLMLVTLCVSHLAQGGWILQPVESLQAKPPWLPVPPCLRPQPRSVGKKWCCPDPPPPVAGGTVWRRTLMLCPPESPLPGSLAAGWKGGGARTKRPGSTLQLRAQKAEGKRRRRIEID